MPSKQTHESNLLEIQGLVIPVEWDHSGRVRSVAIASWDETEYLVGDGEIARELMTMLRQRVWVRGSVTNIQGEKRIMKILEFKPMSQGRGKPGPVAALVMAGVFALGAASGAWAQQTQAAQPTEAKPKVEQVKKQATVKAKKTAAHKTAGKGWVKNLQTALNGQGYQLKADGVMGKKTRHALKDYQKKNGLKASGRLDKATKAKLGLS